MTLTELQDQIHQINFEKGWFEKLVSLGEGVALLHSEVSEALEAYRDHELEDATSAPYCSACWASGVGACDDAPHLPKPEGVGSELADVLIRALDLDTRHGTGGLEAAVDDCTVEPPILGVFGDDLASLHWVISTCWETQAVSGCVGALIILLRAIADHYGIDLDAEVERKMAYNRTRSYRHGNRVL